MKNRPAWYTNEHDSSWERVKTAFRNDWEQTKHDFGSKTARDLDQDVDDTVKQAAGADDGFENREQAFRFGHAAQKQYRSQHSSWNDDLDSKLRNDYGSDYDRDRPYIRHAYEYRYASTDRGSTQSEEAREVR
jgi:hypothetical protein